MPTSSDGISTQPPGTEAVSGQKVDSLKWNAVNTDSYAAHNKVKVVAQGGTGGQTVIEAAVNLTIPLLADFAGTHTVGGTATALTLTTQRAYEELANLMRLPFRAASDSAAGGTTINVDGLGAKAVKKIGPGGTESDIGVGDWYQGGIAELRYVSAAASGAGAFVLMQAAGGGAYAVYKHTVPYNDYATMSTNTWFTYPISSEAYDPSGLGALSSNVITPARNGRLEWRVSCTATAGEADSTAFLSRLIKNSDNTQIEVGSVDGVGSGAGSQRRGLSSYGEAAVTAGVGVRLQCHVATTSGTAQYNGWSSLPLPSDIVAFTPLIITLRA